MMSKMGKKALTISTIRKELVDMQYAVRGPILHRATQIEARLRTNPEEYPFSSMVPANIGNPQIIGQPCVAYYRQLVAAVLNPDGLVKARDPVTGKVTDSVALPIPSDIVERAARYRRTMKTGGAYTTSKGDPNVRADVAEGIGMRDGHACDPESIYMMDGASNGVKFALELLVGSENDGILIPVPEYPLYTAGVIRLKGHPLHVYLDEESGWQLKAKDIEDAIIDARSKNITPRAVICINPGNPTGALMLRDEMEKVVRLCEREGVAIVADEVYQQNIYGEGAEFVSFRKVVKDLNSTVELFSLQSASKGFYGECGLRGGYLQIENIDTEVVQIIVKMASINLCANTVGQVVTAAIMKPPTENDESYPLFDLEKKQILQALKRKSQLANAAFLASPGMNAQPAVAAMYAYPKLEMPVRAIEKAKDLNIAPDFLWCSEFMDRTGVITVPGSGFGQKPGTYHFRLTILPPEEDFKQLVDGVIKFQQDFMERYKDSVQLPLKDVNKVVAENDENADAKTTAGDSPIRSH